MFIIFILKINANIIYKKIFNLAKNYPTMFIDLVSENDLYNAVRFKINLIQ